MRYEANLYSTGPKAKIYRFGYEIDKEHIAWKSDGIKNDVDFRRIITEVMFDEDVNKFSSLVILLDAAPSGGIGQQILASKGSTLSEINLMAQTDGSSTNHPSTAKFTEITLNVGTIAFKPGDTTPYQQLVLNFTKGKASWNDE